MYGKNHLYIYSVSDVSSQFSIFKWVGVLVVLLFAIILVFFMKGAEKISIKSTRDIDIIADAFEKEYVSQGYQANREIEETLEIGWKLLSILPRSELKRIDDKYLDMYYGK